MNDFKIALPGTSMWQRWLAKSTVRKAELSFSLLDGTTRRGWVTGLDEEWLFITDSDLHSRRFRINMIVGMDETGRKLHECEFTPQQKKEFEMYSTRFRKACERALEDAGDSAFHKRPDPV